MWVRISRLLRRIVDGEWMDDPEVGSDSWEPDDVDDAADYDPHWA